PDRPRKHQIVPQVNEQRAVHVGQDVGRAALLQHDLVHARAVGPRAKIEYPSGRRPVQVQRQLQLRKRVCYVQARQVIGHPRPPAPRGRLPGEHHLRLRGQLIPGLREQPGKGCHRGRLPAILIRRQRRPRRASPPGKLVLGQASTGPDALQQSARFHPSSLTYPIRYHVTGNASERGGIPRPELTRTDPGEALFGEDGSSWSQTNSLIPIARSARRSYRGKAGSAAARSTITALATVWSAPRQVMTHPPAATMLRYQPAASPKVSGITNPPVA